MKSSAEIEAEVERRVRAALASVSLGTDEIAARRGVSPRKLFREIAAGLAPPGRLDGGRRRWTLDEVIRWERAVTLQAPAKPSAAKLDALAKGRARLAAKRAAERAAAAGPAARNTAPDLPTPQADRGDPRQQETGGVGDHSNAAGGAGPEGRSP